MATIIENHNKAAKHLEEAAKFHREAATFHDEGDNDKAHQSTIKAIRHTLHAKDIQKMILKQLAIDK
ncbi:MAG: hypothetical protein WCL51_03490 [Bacteroidota bacterium]